jgi:hypothetical protein
MPWEHPQSSLLPDGKRLHLNHGPIDLIIECFGDDRTVRYQRTIERFETVLQELAAELPELRRPISQNLEIEGAIARRMAAATFPYRDLFVTPMAAVAGAVADEILQAMIGADDVPKAYVNNGGDVAFHLVGRERFDIDIAARPVGQIVIGAADPVRGVATSGWRGRSFSLGIADSVTVLAGNAACADAAATLIANRVDLPGHPAIRRAPASELSPDSDLGDRQVTTQVGALTPAETASALDTGAAFADTLLHNSRIAGAVLMLNDAVRWVGNDLHSIDHDRERRHG